LISCLRDLQIGGASIKVQVQGGTTDVNRSQILGIIILGSGSSRATVSSRLDAGRNAGTVLGESIGVHAGQIDSSGLGDRANRLVDGELALTTHRHSRSDGGNTGQNGRDFAEDNHSEWNQRKNDTLKRMKSDQRMLRGLDLFKSTGTSDLLYRMTDDSPSSNFFGKQIPGWYLSQGPGEGDLPLRGSS